jgi:hypothetical protein
MVLCVPKKQGSVECRIVWDLRRLNEASEPYRFPVPSGREILDEVRYGVLYSVADLKDWFWQIPVDPAVLDGPTGRWLGVA